MKDLAYWSCVALWWTFVAGVGNAIGMYGHLILQTVVFKMEFYK